MKAHLSAFAIYLVGACLGRTALADEALHFQEDTKSSGIHATYSGDWQYMVGGGAAIFDCSGDGYPDLFLAGGEKPASFFINRSRRGGELRFEKKKSGLELSGVTGAYPLDVDSDGVMDLVLLRVGQNKVMRGVGHCRFTEANRRWRFDGGDAWSTAFAAIWEAGEIWPTIAVGNYIDRHEEMSPWGSCTDNWLHRPRQNNKAFAKPIALKPSFCALSMLFTDWNKSGDRALRVSNDREYYEGGQEQLWTLPPKELPHLASEAEGWKFLRVWGMGIASTDLNHDGYPDYFLTSMADSKLQTLVDASPPGELRPSYRDIAFARGVTAHRPYMGEDLRPSTGWHAEFADVNNDGLQDLFIAKGNVEKMRDFAVHDPNNLLVQQPDGKFVEQGDKSGVGSTAMSRGGGLADFNLDGRLDLIVVNRRDNAQLWRNVSETGRHWLHIKPQQKGVNRDAIGGWLEVKRDSYVERRELPAGGGHASGQLGWRHVGLGQATSAEVRMIWPDGKASPWETLAADHFYIFTRDKKPAPWRPSR